MIEDLLKILIAAIPRIVTAIFILIVFWYISKLINKLIERVAERSTLQRQPVFVVLTTFSRIAILTIGIITALGSAGVHVSALVASLGLSGLALTIATKDAFANLLAGIMMLLYQPFEIGDHIEVGNCQGQVTKMSLRYTHLKYENKEILIPNSSLLTNNVTITSIT